MTSSTLRFSRPPRRGENDEVLASRERRVEGGSLDEGTHPRQVGAGMAEWFSEHRPAARGRADEAEQHAYRGGLPGPVLAHEAGDRSGRNEQVETVDGKPLAESFREPARDDGKALVGPSTDRRRDLAGRECGRAHTKMKARISAVLHAPWPICDFRHPTASWHRHDQVGRSFNYRSPLAAPRRTRRPPPGRRPRAACGRSPIRSPPRRPRGRPLEPARRLRSRRR